MKKTTLFLSLLAAFLLVIPASAAQTQGETMVVTLVRVDGDHLIVNGPDGTERRLMWNETTVKPARLSNGDRLVVKIDKKNHMATEILTIDDAVNITGDLPKGRLAVTGSVAATSPNQLIVKTMNGETAFVVNPEKLYPPIPTPKDNVVVLYRVVEKQGKDDLIATELVWLPKGVNLTAGSNVRVSYQDIEPPVERQARVEVDTAPPVVETRVDVDFDDEPVVETTYTTRTRLPQTAGNMPLLGLLSVLAIAGAIALRATRP